MTVLGDRIWHYLNHENVVNQLTTYFRGTGFTGRAFEMLAGGGDRDATCNEFTADDIVAVSLLGVHIPPAAALELLEPTTTTVTDLLAVIPNRTDLWRVDRSEIDTDSPADELWRHLDDIVGVGWVTASKLIARKRPQLIPVFDRVVKKALLADRSDHWWVSLWDELQDERLRQRLNELKQQAGLDEGISLLRVLDVAVWMGAGH